MFGIIYNDLLLGNFVRFFRELFIKLEIVLSASAFWRGGRKGGSGGIPPAEPVNETGSDFFKYTPPILQF